MLTIQCENVNRGHTAIIITTNVQNGVPYSTDTSLEISFPFVSRLNRQLSAVRQTRPHSEAAAVGLSKVSKSFKVVIVYPFVANCSSHNSSITSFNKVGKQG